MTYTVASETGRLRRVIVHRPGLELNRLTPSNRHDLLFDDVVWAARAREEHDAFVATMTDRGVEVLDYGRLLGEALDDEEAREWAFDRLLNERTVGPALARPLRDLGRSVDGRTLARLWIGGIIKSDLSTNVNGLLWSALGDDDFLMTPLPNTMFTRDNSAWAYGGVSLNPMSKPARKRETLHTYLIYRWHPLFRDAWEQPDGFSVWLGNESVPDGPATIEGGDVQVIGNRSMLIGLSERTTAQGVEVLACHLFKAGVADRVVVVQLPKQRAFMHLDTVMTMVNQDTFVAYPGLVDSVRSFTLTLDGGELRVDQNASLRDGLSAALGTDVKILVAKMSMGDAEREQWDDGNNFLALSPGVVIGYERNVRTNAMLRDHGVEVAAVAGSELGRGRGGPRCMTCPIEREPLD
ncbi:MAG: arginine deiminase [Actinomycetes bacterium]